MDIRIPERKIRRLPEAWRSSFCRRIRLPFDPAAPAGDVEERGAVILACHHVADGEIAVIRRIRVGAFRAPTNNQQPTYDETPQWWDIGDPPIAGNPRAFWRWWIAYSLSHEEAPRVDTAEPGFIIGPLPAGSSVQAELAGITATLMPFSELSGEQGTQHQPAGQWCVQGPRSFCLIAEWDNRQLRTQAQNFRIGSSFGAMEGTDWPIDLLSPRYLPLFHG